MPKPTKLQLAKLIRKRAEKHVNDLISYSDPKTLECLCAISSYALTKKFNDYRYKAKMIVGMYDDKRWGNLPHCWVESDDGIWDITATQFDRHNNPKITHVKLSDSRFKKEKEIRLDLANHILRKWPSEQKPLLRSVKLLMED